MLLAGCAATRPPPPAAPAPPAPSDNAAAVATLLRTDRNFASASVARGTPAAFAEYSAEAVVNLPANGPATATKEGLLARLANMGDTVLTWEPQQAQVTASGEMGFTWGEWALRQGGGAGPVRTRGKYLNVWRRQADGSWKAIVDIANTSALVAPPGAPTSPTPPGAPAAAAGTSSRGAGRAHAKHPTAPAKGSTAHP